MKISEILENTRRWFAVEFGDNPDRAAFGVAQFLQDHGKQIVPIFPRAEIVHGVEGCAAITDTVKLWGSPMSSTYL